MFRLRKGQGAGSAGAEAAGKASRREQYRFVGLCLRASYGGNLTLLRGKADWHVGQGRRTKKGVCREGGGLPRAAALPLRVFHPHGQENKDGTRNNSFILHISQQNQTKGGGGRRALQVDPKTGLSITTASEETSGRDTSTILRASSSHHVSYVCPSVDKVNHRDRTKRKHDARKAADKVQAGRAARSKASATPHNKSSADESIVYDALTPAKQAPSHLHHTLNNQNPDSIHNQISRGPTRRTHPAPTGPPAHICGKTPGFGAVKISTC